MNYNESKKWKKMKSPTSFNYIAFVQILNNDTLEEA